MRSLLSFFTVLPVRSASLSDAARAVHLLPLVGLFTGAFGALLVLLAFVLPPSVGAVLALGGVLLAAGFHHADGVLDVGDALMVRGDPTRRREVLKDARIGIGGLGALFLVYAPAATALAALADESPLLAASSLLAAEIGARSAMLLVLALAIPQIPAPRPSRSWRLYRDPNERQGSLWHLSPRSPSSCPSAL